ncbi:hypothetical protein GCM10022224_049020 [Nonomuraea antimicrobica]|uniref:ABC3 transporter permease C-terminal domain-containing protein n=1 Tax=Nonomuraea antimicrobica TaxID=561173 RepID=A0ABP7C785_9ACTN
MSALRAALRISRRDALRSKGRSALIMVMIGLPVLVISAVLTQVASTDLSPREEVPHRLGSVADAAVYTQSLRLPVAQDPAGRFGWQSPSAAPPAGLWPTSEVAALTGGRLLPFYAWSTEVRLFDGFDRVDLLEVDLRDPLATGLRTLAEGRLPATLQEVVVTPALLDRGVRVGGTIEVTRRAAPKRVVGVVEHPTRPGIQEVAGLYGSVRPDKTDPQGSGWLVDTPAPVTWEEVHRLNQAGLRVASRAVIDGPRMEAHDLGPRSEEQWRWTAIGVLLVVTETVLLAGPAFAVGLRRRGRELATIAAQGGSPAHLRTIVLADGLVLGGVAALTAGALGVGAGLAVEQVLARLLDWTSSLEVPWAEVLATTALGLLSAVVAAVAPAVRAARQHPAQVLAGRPAEIRDRAGAQILWPVLGLVLVVLGVVAMLTLGTRDALVVVASATVVLFGMIALTPWVVRRTGGLAARLPLPARLSVRDGARHGIRTTSAVAAVMAATMGAITVGIAYNSVYAMYLDINRTEVPDDTLIVHAPDIDDRAWSNVRAVAQERLPRVSLVTGLETVDDKGRSLVVTVDREETMCSDGCEHFGPLSYEAAVGDSRLLAQFQGRRDPRSQAALTEGKAVAFDSRLVRDGEIQVRVHSLEGDRVATFRVPAVAAQGVQPHQGGAVLPASALTGAGLRTAERRIYASHAQADVRRFERDLQAVARPARAWLVDFEDSYTSLLLVMNATLAGALVLVLGGTFAATGLAVADMRRDLDTLSAVGGRPLTRRLVVAAQAGYVAGLGAFMGLAGGAVAGYALSVPLRGIRGMSGGPEVGVPWASVAVVVGLPLLAALLAGLFTRTRTEPVRRVA